MELEGLGVSLVGRAIYVHGDWIPWEFISGVKYNCKILVTGIDLTTVELENSWNYIVRPETAKDWSILATILKGIGGTVLLTILSELPASFHGFMAGILAEGRTVITRVWIHSRPPIVPDAIFFPPGASAAETFPIVEALPARDSHGPVALTHGGWETFTKVASDANIGLVVSDIGEEKWTVFWHKLADSRPANPAALTRRGVSLLRIGTALVEKNNHTE